MRIKLPVVKRPEIIEEKSGKLNLYLEAVATFWSSQRQFAHCCHLY